MRRKILNSTSKSKRGNIFLDGIIVFIVLFVFIVIGLIAFFLFGDISKDLQSDDFLGTEAKELIDDNTTKFPLWLDGAFVFLLILFWAVTLALTFVIDSHPIFFTFAIIVLIFVIFIGAVLSNTYYDISQDDDLIEYSAQLPKTQWIMDRLPIMVIMIITSMLLVFGIKNRLG